MRLRKRIIALGLTCVLAVLPVIPSQAAVWKQENGKWRYYLSNGFMVTNTMKSNSNGNEWWWLGDDGYILEGHGGEIVTNNGRINFRLKDDGQVDPNGWDADGNTYDLRAIMTQGKNKNFKSCWGILNDNDDQNNAWIYYDEQRRMCWQHGHISIELIQTGLRLWQRRWKRGERAHERIKRK